MKQTGDSSTWEVREVVSWDKRGVMTCTNGEAFKESKHSRWSPYDPKVIANEARIRKAAEPLEKQRNALDKKIDKLYAQSKLRRALLVGKLSFKSILEEKGIVYDAHTTQPAKPS